MEEAASVSLDPYFVPAGWFSDVDDGSSPPAAKKKKLSLSLSKKPHSQDQRLHQLLLADSPLPFL